MVIENHFSKLKLTNREAVTRPKIGHGNWFPLKTGYKPWFNCIYWFEGDNSNKSPAMFS